MTIICKTPSSKAHIQQVIDSSKVHVLAAIFPCHVSCLVLLRFWGTLWCTRLEWMKWDFILLLTRSCKNVCKIVNF